MTDRTAKKQWFRMVYVRITAKRMPPPPEFFNRSDDFVYWTLRALAYDGLVQSSMECGELEHWQSLLAEADLVLYILLYNLDI